MITEIDEKTVQVDPGEPSAEEVLEYAELLIETEGWNSRPNDEESSPEVGWTLHDAIGEANRRLFGEVTRSDGKDGVKLKAGGNTRTAATEKLAKVLGRKDDKVFNDKAKDVSEVLGVLRQARGAA